uniref:Lunapark zinc ribbon domain-containing protein n=1 Tax=Cyprinus carpio TaxID=7962 RepID=A0A8C1SJ87_CYPCA
RYALICQQCLSHNGMALKEEFEYIDDSDTRPQAPRLPEFTAETKMSQDPPAVAMETDLSSSPPAPEGQAASPGHVEAEPGEQQAEESLSEEKKPGDPDQQTGLPDKSEGEHDVSAMEVE